MLWKDCENQSCTSGDIWQITLNHDVNRTRCTISISLFSAETTGPIFTRYSGISGPVNRAYTRCYPIPFLNTTATKVAEFAIFYKIGCHGNVPWDIGKRCPDLSSAPKTLSFGENIAKIGPADLEIICLQETIKKEEDKKEKKEKVMEGKIYKPVSNLAERAKKMELREHSGTRNTRKINS